MANQTHLDTVQKGTEAVGQYLEAHPDTMFDLSGADLAELDLQNIDLRGANLSHASLKSANLRMANLRSADLRFANLANANLSRARFDLANLSYAKLCHSYISHTIFSKANLTYTDLRNANGSETDLSSANLTGAKVHNLKTSKWKAVGMICQWLNMSPTGEDSPKPDQIWKPEATESHPFEDPDYEYLILELATDPSFQTLSTIMSAFTSIADRFASVEPNIPLQCLKVLNDKKENMEIHLTAGDAALAALARLLEAAIRSMRSLEGKALVESPSPLPLDSEESAKSTAFIEKLNLSNHPQTSSAILHIAKFTRMVYFHGEVFQLKDAPALSLSETNPHSTKQ